MTTNSVHSTNRVNLFSNNQLDSTDQSILQNLPKLNRTQPVIDSYSELLLGSPSPKNNDPAGDWIYQTLLSTALGFKASEKKEKSSLITTESLVRHFGVANTLTLLAHSYRMSHQVAMLNGKNRREALVAKDFFHQVLKEMNQSYPTAYKELSEGFKAGKIPLLNRKAIQQSFIEELTKDTPEGTLSKIGKFTVGLLAISMLGIGMSHISRMNRGSTQNPNDNSLQNQLNDTQCPINSQRWPLNITQVDPSSYLQCPLTPNQEGSITSVEQLIPSYLQNQNQVSTFEQLLTNNTCTDDDFTDSYSETSEDDKILENFEESDPIENDDSEPSDVQTTIPADTKEQSPPLLITPYGEPKQDTVSNKDLFSQLNEDLILKNTNSQIEQTLPKEVIEKFLDTEEKTPKQNQESALIAVNNIGIGNLQQDSTTIKPSDGENQEVATIPTKTVTNLTPTQVQEKVTPPAQTIVPEDSFKWSAPQESEKPKMNEENQPTSDNTETTVDQPKSTSEVSNPATPIESKTTEDPKAKAVEIPQPAKLNLPFKEVVQNLIETPSLIESPEYKNYLQDSTHADELAKELWLHPEYLTKNGLLLEFVKPLQNDPKAVLSGIKQNAKASQFASKELKKDPNFIVQAWETNPNVLPYLEVFHNPNDYWFGRANIENQNKEMGIQLVTINPMILEDFPPYMQESIPVVGAAVAKDREAIQFSSPKLTIKDPSSPTPEVVPNTGWFGFAYVNDATTEQKMKNSVAFKQGRAKAIEAFKQGIADPAYDNFLEDVKTAREVVSYNGLLLKRFKKFQNDPVTAMLAAENNIEALASTPLNDNAPFMSETIKKIDKKCASYIGAKLQDNDEFAVELVSTYGVGLNFFTQRVRELPHVITSAIQEDRAAEKYVGPGLSVTVNEKGEISMSPRNLVSRRFFTDYAFPADKQRSTLAELKSDTSKLSRFKNVNDDLIIMRELFAVDGLKLGDASAYIQKDPRSVLIAIKNNYKAGQYAPDLFNDKKFVLDVAKVCPKCLRFLGPNLKDDEAFALELVSVNGMALEHFSERIQNMPHVVQAATAEDPMAKQFAGSKVEITYDRQGQMTFSEKSTLSKITTWISSSAKITPEEREQVTQTLINHPEKFSDPAYEKYKNDVVLFRDLVKTKGALLKFAAKEIQKDPLTVLIAIENTSEAGLYATELFNDPKFVPQAMAKNKNCYIHIGKDLQDNDALALEIVPINGLALSKFSTRIQNMDNVVQAAVIENRVAIQYAGSDIEMDPKTLKVKSKSGWFNWKLFG